MTGKDSPPVHEPLAMMEENGPASQDPSISFDSNFLTSRTALVIIGEGESQVEYHIHERLLQEASEFFNKALTSGFKEAHEKKILLPEENVVSDRAMTAFFSSTLCFRNVSRRQRLPYFVDLTAIFCDVTLF